MKRAFYLYITALCLLVGLTGCGSSGNKINYKPTPTQVPDIVVTPQPTASANSSVNQTLEHIATLYYDAVQAKNYPQAYSYLDTSATGANGKTITLSSFEQLAQTTDSQEGQVVSFMAAAYSPMVVMTITRSQMGPYHAHLQLKQVGNTWKITSLDRI